MSPTVLLLILASVSLSALAQISLKAGMTAARTGTPDAGATASPGDLLLAAASQPGVLGGLLLYALGTVVWLLVLSRLDVSVAYPFVALGFLMVMGLGAWCFGEPITAGKLAGTLLVGAGVYLLART
jgi:drug/metabolite transporter (DMT)-like permease